MSNYRFNFSQKNTVFQININVSLKSNIRPGDTSVNPIPHRGEGGGEDSALLQIVFFITSVRDAAEPRNFVTFPKTGWTIRF